MTDRKLIQVLQMLQFLLCILLLCPYESQHNIRRNRWVSRSVASSSLQGSNRFEVHVSQCIACVL